MKNILSLLVFLSAISLNQLLHAAIIVDVRDATINAGQSGTVDVLIRSTGTDEVDLYNIDFQISAVGGPTGTLQFLNMQVLTDDQATNYIFSPTNLNNPSHTNIGITPDRPNPTRLILDDFTDPFPDLDSEGSDVGVSNFLLARLDVQHVLATNQTAIQADGEQFRIVLQNSVDTFFDDSFGGPVNIDASSFNATGVGGGLITITGATAIPEPTSLAVLTMLSAGAFEWSRRRSRKQSNYEVK